MRQRYLVAYDIRDPKRLQAVHQCVLGYGEMLQYSVYVCDLSPTERLELVADVSELLDHRRDSVVLVDLGPAGARGAECFEFIGARNRLPGVNRARIL